MMRDTAKPLAGVGDPEEAVGTVLEWLRAAMPSEWVKAAEDGGAAAVRTVRTSRDYEACYPTLAEAGLVAPTWPVECGGLGWAPKVAAAVETALRPYHLPKLNPLGLNLVAPALYAHGTHQQRLLPAADRAQRGGVVPAVQRAGRWE